MDNQTESFNPYQQWLEIPVEDQPPNHYRLLGVDDFESDSGVIDEAAKGRVAYLHRIAAGPQRKAVQQLLSEVAVARRTLLSAEAKATYDQQLQAADEPEVASFAPAIQIAAADSGVRRAAQGKTSAQGAPAGTTRRRKKSGMNDWRIHAISASVLLVITLIVLFINRGNGTRVASSPDSSAYQPATNSTSRKRPAAQQGRSLATELNRQTSTASPSLTAQLNQKPAAGSRSLAGDFAAAKRIVSAQVEAKKPPVAANSVTLTLDDHWLDGLTIAEDFSSPLQGRFSRTDADERIALEDERLVIKKAAADKKNVALVSKQVSLIPGQAIALESNLTTGLPNQMRVGLGTGPLRIFVQSKKKNLEISAFGTKLATLTPVGDQNLTLMLIRDVQQHDAVNWIVRSGKKNVSGRVRVDALPLEAAVSVLALCPQKSTKKPVWVDNLRHGTQSQPPDLKNPKEKKVTVPKK